MELTSGIGSEALAPSGAASVYSMQRTLGTARAMNPTAIDIRAAAHRPLCGLTRLRAR